VLARLGWSGLLWLWRERKERGGEGSMPAEGIGAQEWFMVENLFLIFQPFLFLGFIQI
jgi:hypothetical protein